jgi:hypothetical protein
MTKQQKTERGGVDNSIEQSKIPEKEKQIKIKMIKVLMMYEEADTIPLDIKKIISEHLYDEIKDDFNLIDRGL